MYKIRKVDGVNCADSAFLMFEFGDSGDYGPPSGQWIVAVIGFQKIHGLHGLIML